MLAAGPFADEVYMDTKCMTGKDESLATEQK